jgi:hypothetical protein
LNNILQAKKYAITGMAASTHTGDGYNTFTLTGPFRPFTGRDALFDTLGLVAEQFRGFADISITRTNIDVKKGITVGVAGRTKPTLFMFLPKDDERIVCVPYRKFPIVYNGIAAKDARVMRIVEKNKDYLTWDGQLTSPIYVSVK